MGGYGSTRWDNHLRQCTVNECHSYDLATVNIRDYMQADEQSAYGYNWTANGEPSGNMAVVYLPDKLAIVLVYSIVYSDERPNDDIEQYIELETTPLNFGGVRYWMKCPSCDKRVRTVHKPTTRKRFKCRTCWNLSYFSSQESRHDTGRAYQVWALFDKQYELEAKLRRCRHGSKNHKRYSVKLMKLYDRIAHLLELQEQQNAVFKAKIPSYLDSVKYLVSQG